MTAHIDKVFRMCGFARILRYATTCRLTAGKNDKGGEYISILLFFWVKACTMRAAAHALIEKVIRMCGFAWILRYAQNDIRENLFLFYCFFGKSLYNVRGL